MSKEITIPHEEPHLDRQHHRTAFIAASGQVDTEEIQEVLRSHGILPVTLEQNALPGFSWADCLHRCVMGADMVVAVVGDRKRDSNVFFELGYAAAMNKPALLLIPPNYPLETVAPSGIPYLRTDPLNRQAIAFGLEQIIASPPRKQMLEGLAENCQSRPLGTAADKFLTRLSALQVEQNPALEFENVIYEAILESGVSTISRGQVVKDRVVDFAVWSNDLEPTIANPLLVECKFSLQNQREVNEVIGQMFRALDALSNGCGLVIYKESNSKAPITPGSLPVIFISAEEFLKSMRDFSFGALVRSLRNRLVHG